MGLAYRSGSPGRTIAANVFDTAPVLRQFVDNDRPIPVTVVTWPQGRADSQAVFYARRALMRATARARRVLIAQIS
jgi:hypothetical protein